MSSDCKGLNLGWMDGTFSQIKRAVLHFDFKTALLQSIVLIVS